MAFTVEDGTGVADANSYVPVAFADSYFADRGITAWTGTDPAKQALLIKATDYIEGRFGPNFIGDKKTAAQGLSWPRSDADDFADTEIPVKLKRACCEYAVRAIAAELAPDPLVDASGFSVVTTREKVGPLETESTLVGAGIKTQPMLFKPYPAADMLLKGLLNLSTGRVIR